ncbi:MULTISPECIES: TonB-dependent siderophore receptor [Sphingomonas]|uniref:Iron complex outermembrane receptor protein n=1 Tax=Sphingomonas leidyi TaxID=68569 RepID=A0A7X5ZUA6_9SPHN|nr:MULTISPECIES: TonB-dependent receptor [Sphingomonas]MBN8811574.1 TonB-dependent receptor [Sphingomonas sp.]NIJ63897.1 iron complex outermembrane receptor protein [Sphingomonas leidyi]OJY49819.1 MAG: TonB-dependent receptor [Sphingomonas sp. 67-41]
MRFRSSSLLAIATTLAFAVPPAFAQDTAEPQADQAPPPEDTQIVVTGTRAQGRSRLDTASPVDVLSGTALRNQGTTELGAALAAIAPSIDFPRPSAVDGTDAIRPATLRGLSPDQTLVLINGVRANASALLNINGSVGRGAAAVDLNTIPATALERIEVLRDGASAQYGSDAIAGVINVRLREARSGGGATATYGFYATDIDTARGSRSVTGEPAFTASAWQGIGFGEDGYVTLSGEYLNREATNRADFDPRVTPSRVTGRFGDPAVEQYTGYINAGTGIGDNFKLYGWFGYQDRDSRSAAFPRLPAAAGAVSGIYPNGFLPIINTKSTNANGALGIKGDLAGWDVDLNVAYGRNKIAYYTRNSANYAYGNASPTSFYDGALIYDQWVAGLDVSRKFDVFQSLNVAFGIEGRREGFKITPGEPASWNYPATGAVPGQAPGAQGFGGFSPLNAIERSRKNVSGYLDIEAQITDKLLIGLAGRGEHYTDFGDTATGKVSLRYDIAPWFALRGTASTGFRAPSLQQQYFTSIASVVQNGSPVLTGTFPSVSVVGAALGGLPLEPERSTNLSVGTVIRSGGFDLTIDAYQIRLRNQLALSENIQASFSPQVAALLASTNTGAQAARFFINGLRSRVRGIDAVAHYRLPTGDAGTFDFTIAGNLNQTKVDRSSIPTSTGTINPAPVLFARSRILTIEQGTPGQKVTGSIDWSLDKLAITARASYYGDVNQPGTTPAADIHSGRHTITDLELRYQALKGAQFALGVNNLFDVYPDYTIAANNSTGVVGFPYYSPFGFGGRYVYARLGLSW